MVKLMDFIFTTTLKFDSWFRLQKTWKTRVEKGTKEGGRNISDAPRVTNVPPNQVYPTHDSHSVGNTTSGHRNTSGLVDYDWHVDETGQ